VDEEYETHDIHMPPEQEVMAEKGTFHYPRGHQEILWGTRLANSIAIREEKIHRARERAKRRRDVYGKFDCEST
jgi:hypothetical protein